MNTYIMASLHTLLIIMAITLSSGCTQLVLVEEDERCGAALLKLEACGAILPDTRDFKCDPVLAETVQEMSCAQVAEGLFMGAFDAEPRMIPKSRRGGKDPFACWLGFNFACPEPECIPDPSIPAPGADDPCSDYLQYEGCGSCEYYRCREREAQCGEEAYLEGFVGKYCDRFATVTEPKVQARTAQWLSDVRQCLITELEAGTDETSSCEEIEDVGIASHSTCYVDSGFCSLGVAAWFAIVHTIDPFDVPFKQILATGNGCIQRWFGND